MSAQKNIDEHDETVSAYITPGLISEYLSDRPHDLPETLTIKEAIERLDEWEKDSTKRHKHTMCTDVQADIDIDVDLEFDDIEVYIDDNNLDEVVEYIDSKRTSAPNDIIELHTLHDELKIEICRKAMGHYTLDQLERRLGMDWT